MEGLGSRQSRASSRYASNPSAPPVFNGPVRKWKKQWVSSQSNNQNNGNNRNTAPSLFLCRWTPLSATASADEPRKRRFRYTPIVPIHRGNMEARERVSNEAGTNTRSQPNSSAEMLENPSTGEEARKILCREFLQPTKWVYSVEPSQENMSINLKLRVVQQEPGEDQADSSKSPADGSSNSEGKREVTPMTS